MQRWNKASYSTVSTDYTRVSLGNTNVMYIYYM